MEAKELISIVIVNYNGAALLRPCLRSVFAQPYRPIEVIVVDNASIDESCEIVKREFPEARLIGLKRNTGFAEGNNIGVRHAKGDLIVLLNNDAEVAADWLPPLVELLELPGVGIAASTVITDGVPEAFYAMNGTINYTGYNIMRHFRNCSHIFYAGGTSMMFRKSRIGEPFLSEYFLYQEDVYASWRRRLRGDEIRMAEGSVVQHVGSATTKQAASALITFCQERNRLLNLLLFYEGGTLLKLLPYLCSHVIARLTLSALTPSMSFVGTARAMLWLLTHAKWIQKQRKDEQSLRVVSDARILALMSCEVFDPSRSPRVLGLFNIISRWYAMLVRLPFHDREHTQ